MTEYVDADDVTYPNYREYVGILLGLCGCRDAAILDDVAAILGRYLNAYFNGEAIFYTALPVEGPEKYTELLLHMLDHAGLLEHGMSVRGSWLTDKGKDVARQLRDETVRP